MESNEVSISNLAIVSSSSTGSGLFVEGGDGEFSNLRLSYNNISYQAVEDFNEIKDSEISNNNLGILISGENNICLLYTSPSPRDISGSRMPSSA